MTAENDEDVPEMPRYFGLLVSEWVTYTLIVLAIIAVIFGSRVSAERDAQAERAMASLDALAEESERIFAMGGSVVCDDTLLDSELLANDYLTLSIRPAPIDEDDASAGFGPALHVSVVEEEVSGDTWDTANRLMALVKEADSEEAEASKDASRGLDGGADADADADADGDADEDEPEGRLRRVRKTGYGEDEKYLRYDILATTDVKCSQDA